MVANSRFLKDNPSIASGDWSTLIGVATLFWVGTLGLVMMLFMQDEFSIDKYLTLSPMLISFLVGSVILGVLCSWVGAYLWNRASFYLPVSLAGQLTIFETIFGLLFVYAIDQRLPPTLETFGIALFIISIIYGIRLSSQNSSGVVQHA